jgi:pimeloyl-ACP methyl ester carboxylesterase
MDAPPGADLHSWRWGGRGERRGGLARIKAATLLIYAPDDLVLRPNGSRPPPRHCVARESRSRARRVPGPCGHYNGVVQIAQAGERIADFLARAI